MSSYRKALIAAGSLLVFACHQNSVGQASRQSAPDARQIERGRYLVEITGCNDCHTARYAEAGGKVAEAERLKGDTLGYRGPWGTTYATNLRLSIGKMTEEQWLQYARSLRTRPPMPWFNVRAMNEGDLRAMHQYIRSLGISGNAAPAFVPPDKAPKPPFVQWPLPGK